MTEEGWQQLSISIFLKFKIRKMRFLQRIKGLEIDMYIKLKYPNTKKQTTIQPYCLLPFLDFEIKLCSDKGVQQSEDEGKYHDRNYRVGRQNSDPGKQGVSFEVFPTRYSFYCKL